MASFVLKSRSCLSMLGYGRPFFQARALWNSACLLAEPSFGRASSNDVSTLFYYQKRFDFNLKII